nr:MAG TPA: hypothetical protein [Caudoviricetes sp.]
MIDETIIKLTIEKILEQPIIKILEYSREVNGEYLIAFVYEDKKYNQVIKSTLILPERIFNK